ncbi:thylakoid membrane photosystem I accumulation factor [Altericista sp. CCNU0014]|uniref:thylakoid membrane photosystem I accumulation factor n=1 Tax=Altericista sp. CCNU0014 TaxID=3082949 RepID=UPI00384E248B
MAIYFQRYFSKLRHHSGKVRHGLPKVCFRPALIVVTGLIWIALSVGCPDIARASLQDDRFDGNIFALYAGNGSLIPPRVTLAQSFSDERPTLLTFYIEDSRDCKQFSNVISELQAYYGRVIDFIPVNVDSIPMQASYTPQEPGFYYKNKVPQTLLFDASGKKVLEVVGKGTFDEFDDTLRELFDLLPRTESVELKRRPLNEVNAELVK